MKQLQGSNILFIGVAVALVAAPPVWAKPAKVTGVKLDPTNNGLNVVLETSTATRPQVLTSQQGKTLVADISNAQLNLPAGKDFRQAKPAPGIDSVVVTRLDSSSIRLMVTGTTNAPNGQMQRNDRGVTFSVSSTPEKSTSRTSTPERISQVNPSTTSGTTFKPGQSVTVQKPVFPNPEITVDGKPVPPSAMRRNQAQPPFLPRAVAPPVGDMAISNTDSSPALIDLGSQERVPRLVLRDAPVREVLSLLARAAGLNLAYTTATPQGQQGQPAPTAPGAGGADGPRVTLDIQDESVQDVFNHVLRITGLQANREGRTIFVGPRLPNDARNLVTRSYRLNQVTVGVALNFLVAMGAESAVSRERTITSVQAVPVGGGQAPATQTQTSTETRIETQRIDFQDSTPLLRGLEVVGDERTNSVTLIGSPKQVQVASAQLIQLDSRRRQVAINVKIADINLAATEDINTSFSFGLGDTFLQNDRGTGIINFGTRNPSTERSRGSIDPTGFARQFLARLQAQVQNGNAKVLTDPTLIVQEGQQAAVNLTQEVVGNVTRTITQGSGGLGQDTTTIQKERVGLTVGIKIERVDDNGFVALSVAPTVRAVQDQYEDTTGNIIALINERSLTSGLIRLRDNQTLILSGIIQESDRTSVSKVPLLGDIPILGALFRSTNKQNQRQEVIVLLTPQIMDDSERSSSLGYNYNPSPDARQMLERSQNRKVQMPNGSR